MLAHRPRDPRLEKTAARFLGAFEHVFGHDWEHTKDCLRSDLHVERGHTFVNPGKFDEDANWCSRAGLLEAYRDLAETLMRRGAHPDQFDPDELN